MANVERVDFQGQGGDDTFTVGSLAGTTITAILFSGGDGNDTLDASAAAIGITASGGAGNDSLTGGTAADTLNGDAGNDTLEGRTGADAIFGEDGDDLNIWRNGDGTDTFDGGAGTDTQQLFMSDTDGDTATLGASGADAVFARTNLVAFKVTTTSVEKIDFRGQGGDDKPVLSASLAGTSGHAGAFHRAAPGTTRSTPAGTSTAFTADGGDRQRFHFRRLGRRHDFRRRAGSTGCSAAAATIPSTADAGAASEIGGEAGDDTTHRRLRQRLYLWRRG